MCVLCFHVRSKLKARLRGREELLPPGPPGHPAKGNPFGLVVSAAVNSMQQIITEGQFVWRVVQRLWRPHLLCPFSGSGWPVADRGPLPRAHPPGAWGWSDPDSADLGVGSVPCLDTRELRSGQGPGFSKPHFLVCGQDSSDFPSGKLWGHLSITESGRSSCSSQGQGDRLSAPRR